MPRKILQISVPGAGVFGDQYVEQKVKEKDLEPLSSEEIDDYGPYPQSPSQAVLTERDRQRQISPSLFELAVLQDNEFGNKSPTIAELDKRQEKTMQPLLHNYTLPQVSNSEFPGTPALSLRRKSTSLQLQQVELHAAKSSAVKISDKPKERRYSLPVNMVMAASNQGR